MPEGPEIRRAADTISKAIVGQTVHDIYFAFERLKPFADSLRGQRISAVDTAGKAMLVRFANGYSIYSHNQLYGRWWVRRAGSYPDTGRELRLAIHTRDKSALLYSASDIEVLTADEIDQHPFLRRLGPDALDKTTTAEQVLMRLKDRRFYRKRLTTLLLDQGFLCGLGNYLRSEILFVAGAHPSLRPVDCPERQLKKVARAALTLTRRSYRHNGVTNDLARAKALKAAGWHYADYRHHVFDREGKTCFVCATPIIKIEQGRRVYYCPSCQVLNPP